MKLKEGKTYVDYLKEAGYSKQRIAQIKRYNYGNIDTYDAAKVRDSAGGKKSWMGGFGIMRRK